MKWLGKTGEGVRKSVKFGYTTSPGKDVDNIPVRKVHETKLGGGQVPL